METVHLPSVREILVLVIAGWKWGRVVGCADFVGTMRTIPETFLVRIFFLLGPHIERKNLTGYFHFSTVAFPMRFMTDDELVKLSRSPEGRLTVRRMQEKLLRGLAGCLPRGYYKYFRRHAARITLCGRLLYAVHEFEHHKQAAFVQPGNE